MPDHILSASQIQTWLDCQRKWSFIYQDHAERVQGKAAALGTLVHKILEEYYHGTPLPFSSLDEETCRAAQIAMVMLEHLPAPAPHLITEGEFGYQARHAYRGYIDLQDSAQITVHDFKTTSDFRYAKNEASLLYNTQAILYGCYAIGRWQTPEVTLQWTYGRTRGKAISMPVRVKLTVDHATAMMEIIEQVADEIQAARGKRSLDLAPNPGMCSAYGGCPFQHICNLGPRDRLRSVMGDSTPTTDLLARLNAARAATTSAAERTLPLPGVVAPGQINPPEAALRETVPGPLDQHPAAPVPVPAETPAPANVGPTKRKYNRKAPAESGPVKPIRVLYLDCQPDCSYTGFEWLVEQAGGIIRETKFHDQQGKEFSVTDYRFMPYGQGPAVLLSGVLQALEDADRIEHLVVRHSPESDVCIQALMSRADRIIVGL